jgi:hypothetical protein
MGAYEDKACNAYIVTWALENQTEFSVGTDDSYSIAPRSVHIAGRGTECRFLYRVTAS